MVARWLLRLLLLLLLLLEASVTEKKSFAEEREMMQPPCVTFWWLLEVEMTVRRRVMMVVVAEGQWRRGKEKKTLVAGKLGSDRWFSSDFAFYFLLPQVFNKDSIYRRCKRATLSTLGKLFSP